MRGVAPVFERPWHRVERVKVVPSPPHAYPPFQLIDRNGHPIEQAHIFAARVAAPA